MLGTKILEKRKSKFNGEIKVVRTLGMGNYIQVNGLTQSGGIVESIWKKTLSKVKKKDKKVNDVLIFGLGGGSVAKLIRKNFPDSKIVGIEIDPVMVELGKKYLELDKWGVDIKIKDIRKFKTRNSFDLVIVDTYLGDKYVDLLEVIPKNSKMIIFNRLYYGDKRPEAVKFGRLLEKKFKSVEWFYPEANLMLICTN